MADKFETWENRNRNTVWVNRTNHKGDLEQVKVGPGMKVQITPEDRRKHNQDAAYDKANDAFSNGFLTQAVLIDTAEDYEELKSNPNAKSETELKELLNLPVAKLKAELAQIDSELVMKRLKEYTETEEAENVTTGKVKAIDARLAEVATTVVNKKIFDTFEESKLKPITLSEGTVMSHQSR